MIICSYEFSYYCFGLSKKLDEVNGKPEQQEGETTTFDFLTKELKLFGNTPWIGAVLDGLLPILSPLVSIVGYPANLHPKRTLVLRLPEALLWCRQPAGIHPSSTQTQLKMEMHQVQVSSPLRRKGMLGLKSRRQRTFYVSDCRSRVNCRDELVDD